jgi:meso-butanediol dehydrogenase/(S,S)-butanediol dehydrogenase/diacetyl reductase
MTTIERVVLITGAARGIGRTIAEHLAGPGVALALTDVLTDDLRAASDAVEALGSQSLTLTVDVTRAAQVRDMVTQVVNRFGRIDAFFNNAGVIDVQPFLDATEENWDRTMSVNAKGVFLCGQAVARQMVKQGSGRIVNTASLAARVGVPDMVAYAASKAAVMSVTRSMALALAEHGITVNALAPGIVDTQMWTKIDAQRGEQRSLAAGEAMAERVASIPLGRAAMPGDVAGVARFLISDDAAYITGQTINIDGGMRHD